MSKFDDKLAGSILLSVEVSQELNPHSRCKLIFRRRDQDPGDRIYLEECLSTTLKISGYDHGGNELVVSLTIPSQNEQGSICD